MEAEWLREALQDDVLRIKDPTGFYKLPSKDPHSFKPFGYRTYKRAIVEKIHELYLDEMLIFFQLVNTALCYDGSRVEVLMTDFPPYRYKTWPDVDRIAATMGAAGFRVEKQVHQLIGYKD